MCGETRQQLMLEAKAVAQILHTERKYSGSGVITWENLVTKFANALFPLVSDPEIEQMQVRAAERRAFLGWCYEGVN